MTPQPEYQVHTRTRTAEPTIDAVVQDFCDRVGEEIAFGFLDAVIDVLDEHYPPSPPVKKTIF